MPNKVQVDFVGNNKPLFAAADEAQARLDKITAPQAISDEQFRRGRQLADANAFAREDAIQRSRAYKNSVEKLAIYRADKAAEVAIEEQTAGKIKQIRGFGAVFRATGLHSIGITESEINAGIALFNRSRENAEAAGKAAGAATAEANAAAAAVSSTTAASSLAVGGISAAFVATAASVTVAGAAVILYATQARTEADARLKTEESIASAINKQVLSLRASLAEYEKFKRVSQENQTLDANLKRLTDANNSTEIKALQDKVDAQNKSKVTELNQLEANLAVAENSLKFEQNRNTQGESGILGKFGISGLTESQKRQNVGQATGQVEEIKKQIASANSELQKGQSQFNDTNKALADVTKNQNKLFADNFDQRIKDRRSDRDLDQRIAKEQIETAKRVQKERLDVVRTLLTQVKQSGADNPFFKILSDDALAVENLREKLKGATPELIRFAEAQQKSITANSLFSARADNLINVSDLKAQADFFRNGQKAETADDLLKRLGFNPVDFQKFNDAQKAQLAGQFGGRQASALANAGVGGRLGGVDVADLALGAFRNAQQRQSSEETVQQRLDRQFKELDSLRPDNDAQRASLQNRITSLSQGVDPTTLRQDTRNRVADALNDKADRAAKQQAEASIALQENTAVLKQLTSLYEKQVGSGNVGGSSNEVKISIDDQTGRATSEIKSPTPRDAGIGFSSTQ